MSTEAAYWGCNVSTPRQRSQAAKALASTTTRKASLLVRLALGVGGVLLPLLTPLQLYPAPLPAGALPALAEAKSRSRNQRAT